MWHFKSTVFYFNAVTLGGSLRDILLLRFVLTDPQRSKATIYKETRGKNSQDVKTPS